MVLSRNDCRIPQGALLHVYEQVLSLRICSPYTRCINTINSRSRTPIPPRRPKADTPGLLQPAHPGQIPRSSPCLSCNDISCSLILDGKGINTVLGAKPGSVGKATPRFSKRKKHQTHPTIPTFRTQPDLDVAVLWDRAIHSYTSAAQQSFQR